MKESFARTLSLILALCLVMGFTPVSALATTGDGVVASGTCGNNGSNVTWVFYDSGELRISGTGDMKNYTNSALDPPWHDWWDQIQTITIEDGVTSIGNSAFDYCDVLVDVTIPNSVTSIGKWVFWGCRALTDIVIPDSVTSIGERAFEHCTSLTSLTLPGSIASMGEYVFSDCSSLTDLIILNGVTHIESFAFTGCTSLTSVTLPQSISIIGWRAFGDCSALRFVYYHGTVDDWDRISIDRMTNEYLLSSRIYFNGFVPAVAPDRKYKFSVVDENGKALSGATVTWNGESQQTDTKGLATFDLLTVGEPVVTVSKDGYITWSNANSSWAQSADRYEIVILYPEAMGGFKLASCRYSNSALMTADTDLLTTTKTVSLGNDLFFVGDLDFGKFYLSCAANTSSKVDHYELWQESKLIATDASGFFSLSADAFQDGGGCFIRVAGKDGSEVDTQINLQFKTAKLNKANSISLGGKSISFQVADDIPFVGGSTFTADLPIQLPITYIATDDKLQIGFNVNVKGGKSPEEQMKKARDTLRYASRAGSLNLGKMDAQQEKIFQSLVKGSNKLEFFKSGQVNVLGYLEANWGNSTATGQIMIQGKISPVKFGYTAWVVVVPVTANIELSMEGAAGVSEISYDWENAALIGTLDFDANAKLTAFGGVGVGKLAGAGAYGSAKLSGGFRRLSLETETEVKDFDLTGELGLKAYLGWFEYKKPFAYNTWHIYTNNNTRTAVATDQEHWQAGLFSAENYQRQDLGYLTEESDWLGDIAEQAQLFAASGASTTLTSLLEGTYRNAQPALVQGADGLYAAFLRADAASGGIYTVVTKFNGLSWATPVRVDAAAVLDAAPALCVDDAGTIWLAYARTKTDADKADLSDYAKKQSVVVGTIDRNTLTFTKKAEYSGVGYAHMPQLALVGGMPTLAWVDSPVSDDNSVLWPQSVTLYTAIWNGAAWSSATIVETVNKPVTQLILGEKDGQRTLAYVADEDGEATTQEDRNLYLNGAVVAQQVQGAVTLQQAPGMSGADYMWNGDGCLELADGTKIPAPGISDEYAVTNERIYYSAAGDQGAHLTTVLYDNGTWSEPVTLTGGERYLENLSVVTWNDQDYLMGMDTLADITETDVIDAKNLVWAAVKPSSDLRIDGLGYPTEGLVAGEDVTITLTVTNAGDHTVNSVDVALGSDHWTETCQLFPGQSLDITRTVICPDALTDYAASVVESGWEDFTPEDNAAILSLGHAQLNVKLKEQRIGTSQALVAIVTNAGIDSDSGTLRFINEAGEVLEEVELSSLSAGDSQVVTYPAQLPNGDYTVILLCGEKSLYSDDVDIIHVMEMSKSTPTVTVTLTNTGGVITAAVTGADDGTYDIVWLRDGVAISGQSEANYTVTAADKGHTVSAKIVGKNDDIGEVIAEGISIPAEVPAAPIVRASAKSGQTTVSWTAPAHNGAPITGYIVELTAPETKAVPVGADATEYTFTGLTNGTEYTFIVKATNAIGTSVASNAVKATPKASTGGNSGGSGSSGGSGGSGTASAGTAQTITNVDGSKTITITNTDGTVKETTIDTDGTKIEIIANPDGSATGTVTVKDGTKATITTTKEGETIAKVVVPDTVDSTEVIIPAKNAKPGTVAIIVNADGTEQVVRASIPDKVGVKVKLTNSATLKLTDNSKYFVDMAGHWAETSVDFVSARELFNGMDVLHFDPERNMSRGMMATVLFRLDGERKNGLRKSFTDVADGAWYADAIAWAANEGIVIGYNETHFCPEYNVTREQLATMIYRYSKTKGIATDVNLSGLIYADTSSISDYAVEAISWLTINGILTGKPSNRIDPQGYATRAEVAAIFERFILYTMKN